MSRSTRSTTWPARRRPSTTSTTRCRRRRRVLALTGSTSGLDRQPLPQDDPRQRKPKITLAAKLVGWQPSVDLDTGLTQTIAFFRALLADLDRS
jgi:UDP-glucuronate decarboxylase